MSDIVIGTAGHIDHGKTSLVKVLTGIETDKLKEEKERGITIEVGYAFLKTPENDIISIIDVPGHEKFIKKMVAGVYGIDYLMLIIAADESIMPQTKEHFEICELLGINKGFIVVTKIDLVDEELIPLIEDEIKDFTQNTFLKNSPIFFVSSKTKKGIDKLKNYLYSLTQKNNIKKEIDNSYFRLPIDRVFTLKGFGTVVTGTGISGKIEVGSNIVILPKELEGKIRNIQVHGKNVNSIDKGHRTALNLQGISKNEINRGDVVTIPELFYSTNIIAGKLKYLKANKNSLKSRLMIKFHSGTNVIPAKIILPKNKELLPGTESYAQFQFNEKIFVLHNDRFIIRSFDDKHTLGGGVVLDAPLSKIEKFTEKYLSYLSCLETESLEQKIIAILQKHAKLGMSIYDLIMRLNYTKEYLKSIIDKLFKKNEIIIYDKANYFFIDKENFKELSNLILEYLNEFHKKNPTQIGMPSEALRTKIDINMDFNLFDLIINNLIQNNKITLKNNIISKKDFKINLDEEHYKNKNKILKIIKDSKYTPPTLSQIMKEINISEKDLTNLINILLNEHKIIKIKSDLYYDINIFEEIKSKLINFLKQNSEISIQEFKNIANASRKYIIPLLEYFDSIKITKRIGDKRVLRN